MVILFRRSQNSLDKIIVKFNGIKADTSYQIYFSQFNEKKVLYGRNLMAGIETAFSSAPNSILITYKLYDGD
ncbi:MAG: Alpha-galactosidase [Candidatus Poribacteria bacterium]|nr:Alpha-galactosidase [Candidatus Poribacteria bacterium]